MNSVHLMGNMTRDVDFKVFDSGSCVAHFGLAINRFFTDSNGEKQESVTFVDIETWGRQAEIASEFLRKGKKIIVEGSLKYDQWEDQDTGAKRSKLSVRAYRIHFAETKAEEEAREKNKGSYDGPPLKDPGVTSQSVDEESDSIPF